MFRFNTLFVFSLLFAVLAIIGSADNKPPLQIQTTFQVLRDEEKFYEQSAYEEGTFSLYPERSEDVPIVSALFKKATISIQNTDDTNTVTFSFVLSAGAVYAYPPADEWDYEYQTMVTLPEVLRIYDPSSGEESLSFELAPSETKVLNLEYINCTSAFTVGTTLSIQSYSPTTGELYEPISVELDLECTAEYCLEQCTDHGTCIEEIGYCHCEGDWRGEECNFRGGFSPEICPGDKIEVSMAFSTTECDAYFGIYHADNLYQSVVYMDFPRDQCELKKPWPLDGSLYHTNLTTYLTPGEYTIGLTQQYGKPTVARLPLIVKDWSDCGVEKNCTQYPKNERCSGHGRCVEENGQCECDSTHFWYDCNRGCEMETLLVDKTGTISSDPNASKYGKDPLYIENVLCVWIVSPPSGDIIDLDFVSFNLDGGSDFLSIRNVDKDNKVIEEGEPLYKMSGSKYPEHLSIPFGKIALILESDYTLGNAGFVIKYSSRNAPLEAKYIVAISVCGGVILIVAVFLIFFFVGRHMKKKEEDLSAALQATSLPWILSPEEEEVETTGKENVRAARLKLNNLYGADDEEESDSEGSDDETTVVDEKTDSSAGDTTSRQEKRKSGGDKKEGEKEEKEGEEAKGEDSSDSETSKKGKRREAGLDRETILKSMNETDEELGWLDLGCLGIECDEHWPRFGLEQGATCPIMEDLKTKITLTNSSDNPIAFCFFHPVDEEKFTLSLCPGRGRIPPQTSITITMNFRLFYTTFVFDHVKLAIYETGRINDDFEGFDPRIDEDDTNLIKPIATARLGISLEGSVSERIDPYEITLRPGTLGVGAFGTVYTGKYRQRIVAVKVMTRQADMMAQIKEEFEKEIELYRRLRNPLLVDFIGASLIPGKLCVATELIRHGSLENMMSAGEIPFVLQTRFAHNIAEAVSYLHSNNVLYRDLKPSNVMIVSFSLNAKINCKIGDFGTARNVADVEEFFLYTAGQGTPIYMAPEVLANKEYNSRADVYSYAVTLWQMISRQRPWDNVPVWEFPQRVINGARPPLPDKETLDSMAVTDDYVRLIKSCWDADARKRPAFTSIISTLGPICKQAKQAFKESGQRINPHMYPVVGETGSLLISAEGGEDEGSARQGGSVSASDAVSSARGGDSTSAPKMPTTLRKQASSNLISSGSSATATSKNSNEGKRPRVGFTMTLADAMSASVPSGTRGDSSLNTGNPLSAGRSTGNPLSSTNTGGTPLRTSSKKK